MNNYEVSRAVNPPKLVESLVLPTVSNHFFDLTAIFYFLTFFKGLKGSRLDQNLELFKACSGPKRDFVALLQTGSIGVKFLVTGQFAIL